jgi:hypothetical protein
MVSLDSKVFTLVDEPVSDANRAYAYLFAAWTGVSIGTLRSTPNLGRYDDAFTILGVICFLATLLYTVLSTNDLKCRLDRLQRCGVTALISIFAAIGLNAIVGTGPIIGSISMLDIVAFAMMVIAIYVFCRLFSLMGLSDLRREIFPAIAAVTFVSVFYALIRLGPL